MMDQPVLAVDDFEDVPEFEEREILAMEKDSIGVYVSGHPLDGCREQVVRCAGAQIRDIAENENGRFLGGMKVKLAGIITRARNQLTKKGEMMRYVVLEDLSGSMEVLVFPSLLRKYDPLLQPDRIVLVEGNLDIGDDAPPKLRLEQVCLLEDAAKAANGTQKLYLKLEENTPQQMTSIKEVLRGFHGDIPVYLYDAAKKETMAAPKSLWISENETLFLKLRALLGEENVKMVEKNQ